MANVFDKEDWATDAMPGGLGGAEAVFETAGRMLTGGQGDVFDRLASGSEEFSDLISSDIKSCNSYSEAKWGAAFYSCMWGKSAAEVWRQAVQTFNSTMDGLQEEWNEALGVNFGIEVAGHGSDERQDDLIDLGIAQNAKYSELKLAADEAREALEEEAERVNQMLENGPGDEESVEYLVSNGYLGWAPYALFGYGQPIPMEMGAESGEDWGETLADAVQNGDSVPPILLQALGYLNTEALRRLEKGEQLSQEEIEFLEAFYGAMEGEFDVVGYDGKDKTGILGLSQTIEERGGYSEGLLELLSENLMHLSNENVGGGFHYLPASVANATLGPNAYPDGSAQPQSWMSDLARLDYLLSQADENVNGGLEFSANITTSIGYELTDDAFVASLSGDTPGFLGEYNHEMLDNLIDVATRNEDANHAILTGEYERLYYGSDNPSMTEKVLEGLYTFNWEFQDDSRDLAATQLTDWIAEAASNEDDADARRQAGEAAAGLIENTTTDYMFAALTDSGFRIDDLREVSFTQLNPELAESLNSVFLSYVEDFGRDGSDGSYSYENDGRDEWLNVDDLGRVRFLQYIMADDETAADAIAAAQMYANENLDSYLEGGGRHELGAGSGKLQGLIESAIMNEAWDRFGDDKAALERETAQKTAGLRLVADAILGRADAVGFMADPVKNAIGEWVQQRAGDQESYSEYINGGGTPEDFLGRGRQMAEYDIAFQALTTLLEDPSYSGQGFSSTGLPAPFIGENGELVNPNSQNVGNVSVYLDDLEDYFRSRPLYVEGQGTVDANDFIGEYSEEYWEGYEGSVERFRSRNEAEYGAFASGEDVSSVR
jgi:hypothetical protein